MGALEHPLAMSHPSGQVTRPQASKPVQLASQLQEEAQLIPSSQVNELLQSTEQGPSPQLIARSQES